jgi:hypothetical protein
MTTALQLLFSIVNASVKKAVFTGVFEMPPGKQA